VDGEYLTPMRVIFLKEAMLADGVQFLDEQ
jgi:hypothetical protein